MRWRPGIAEDLGPFTEAPVAGLGPFTEAPVAGHDHGATLVAGVDELEEQIAATRAQKQVADLVDDEQAVAAEELHALAQFAFTFGLAHGIDQHGLGRLAVTLVCSLLGAVLSGG